jgi:Protein of unknown function (DUF2892).
VCVIIFNTLHQCIVSMEQNVGETDSQVRLVLGALSGSLSLALLGQSLNLVSGILSLPAIASPVLGVVALALLGTAYTRECPVCAVAGMDTTE